MPFVLLSFLIVALDQLVKAAASARLGIQGASVPFLPGVLRLTLVHNYGASWGMLSGKTSLLLIVTGLVCLVILTALLLGRPKNPLGKLSLAFILGGAVGNAVDRFVTGYVVDMFETEFVSFPVFNLADCFITAGAALLILWVLLDERAAKRKRQEASTARWEKSRAEAREEAARAEEVLRSFEEGGEDGTAAEDHDDLGHG